MADYFQQSRFAFASGLFTALVEQTRWLDPRQLVTKWVGGFVAVAYLYVLARWIEPKKLVKGTPRGMPKGMPETETEDDNEKLKEQPHAITRKGVSRGMDELAKFVAMISFMYFSRWVGQLLPDVTWVTLASLFVMVFFGSTFTIMISETHR